MIRKAIHTIVRSRRKPARCIFLLSVFAAIFLLSYLFVNRGTESYKIIQYEQGLPLLLNQANCKIPDISPWTHSVKPLIEKVNFLEDCFGDYYHWTYVNGSSITINTTAVAESGYSVESLGCCYNIVSREAQREDDYDEQADNVVSYSECFPMGTVTQPSSGEFFMVTCKEKSWKGIFRNVYRQHHWIPSVANSYETILKHDYWNKKSRAQSQTPPNVLIIGIDSTSRLNFHRQMTKSKKILQELGAVEMLGYTKVGDNTFPNFAAMLTGYDVVDLARVCQTTPWYTKQDDCPYIWKRFSKANYFTSQIEDGPFFTGFNYKKTGFIKQPVDFYLRPLMLAAHEFAPTILNSLKLATIDHIDCVGYQTNDEVLVDSIKQVIELSHTENVPLYLHSWSTVLSHDNLNYVNLVDELYANLLLYLNAKGQLRNTVLIFLSDHGYRFGKIREKFSGWYEEKLPYLWVYLSPDLRERFPDWQTSLELNSRRLVSTFHLYWTFNEILKTFTQMDSPENEKVYSSEEIIPRLYKNSLLNPVPEDWTCDDVGVSETYCACYERQPLDTSDSNLVSATKFALNYVNSFLPKEVCAELKLHKILQGDIMDKTSGNEKRITFVISFVTDPGKFVMEAYVDYYAETKVFGNCSASSVQRTSKINSDVSCVNSPKLELFCYCK